MNPQREETSPKVSQRYASQALHARYSVHADRFFPSGFVSCENKGALIQIPKLKVASSSLVARSNLRSKFRTSQGHKIVTGEITVYRGGIKPRSRIVVGAKHLGGLVLDTDGL